MDFSLGIYKDTKDTLLIIPQAFDENGVRRDMSDYQVIESPYSDDLVGAKVIELFQLSVNAGVVPKLNQKVYQLATGVKSWSQFCKERILVFGEYNTEMGYSFTYWERARNGAYSPAAGEYSFRLGLDVTEREIGQAVMNAFDSHRR